VLCEQSARDPDTALYRLMVPHWDWNLDRVLMGRILDALNTANYYTVLLNTPKGQTKPRQPEPIRFPWETRQAREGDERWGTARMTIAQAKRWLGW
jgi:hypothetical protein